MGYNLKTLTRDLTEKGLAEDGLVGYGQIAYGAIAALTCPMYAISCANNKIIITPFTNKNIDFANRKEIDARNIMEAKVSGLLTGRLKIKTANEVTIYPIVQGKGAVKQMLVKLGL